MADRGNLTISLNEMKEPFRLRAKRICGSPTALVEQFALAALRRTPEEVWRFCFDLEGLEPNDGDLPILGRIPGGPLSEAIEEIEGYADPGSLKHGDNAFFLRVDGESMADAINGVHHGDLVLLDPDIEVQPHQKSAILMKDGTATFAVYVPRDDGTVCLHKLNPAFQDIIVQAKDISKVLAYRGLIRPPLANGNLQ